jgi:RNA polymerase sigma factor (sigma-70 family)
VGYHYWKQCAKRREREEFRVEEWDKISEEAAGEMEASEAAEVLEKVLGQLGPRDRLVVTLRYVEGLDIEATARRTGWSKAMVKVQCWRALKRLKRIVGESEERI